MVDKETVLDAVREAIAEAGDNKDVVRGALIVGAVLLDVSENTIEAMLDED